jgi:acyl-CoA dehydrogenase
LLSAFRAYTKAANYGQGFLSVSTQRNMDFALGDEQIAIRDAVRKLAARFDAEYWRRRDAEGQFPVDFHRAFAEAGWLGIAMPQEFGGAGLGILEAALLMMTVAESGAGPRKRD